MQSKTRNALGMFNAGLLDAEDIGRIGGEVEELLGSTDNAAKVLDAVLLAREEMAALKNARAAFDQAFEKGGE